MCDNHTQVENSLNLHKQENQKIENFERRGDIKKILDKALESSMRIEKIFSNNCSYSEDPVISSRKESEYNIEKEIEVQIPKSMDNYDDILVIDEPFYDSSILNVIDEMEDFN